MEEKNKAPKNVFFIVFPAPHKENMGHKVFFFFVLKKICNKKKR